MEDQDTASDEDEDEDGGNDTPIETKLIRMCRRKFKRKNQTYLLRVLRPSRPRKSSVAGRNNRDRDDFFQSGRRAGTWRQGKAFDEEEWKKWEERDRLESIRLFIYITGEDGEGDNGKASHR
jgi:hypothetical protein